MSAFPKSARRKIFYAMAFLFAVVAPLTLLYSLGYIPDLNGRGFVATGGVFIKTVQSGARVYVDSEFSRETSFISHGALITDLLPRRYAVRVDLDGHRPWSKVARISSEEVLEFRNILLPPATITPRVVFSGSSRRSQGLFALAGRSEVALETGEGRGLTTVFIIHPLTRRVTATLIKVHDWQWDHQSQSFILGRSAEDKMYWYRLDAGSEREESITFRGLPAGFSAERVTPHPKQIGGLYFFAGGVLFLQGRSSVPVPIAEQIQAYAVTADHIYFVSRNGFFAESDLNGGNTKVLGRKGLLLDEDVPTRIMTSPGGDVVVLDAANGLFLYQPGHDQELELTAGNVKGVDFSKNGDRMLYWDDHRMWIHWLRDNPDQPFDLARSKKQIFYSEAPIRQAYLDAGGSHAFFSTDETIRMTEVDDRGGVNSYELVRSARIDGFVLDKDTPALQWSEGSKLYRAEIK